MIVGAIDISGMQSPGGGAVPYLEPKHQTGMKPSIISIYHTPVISSHDWAVQFSVVGCLRENLKSLWEANEGRACEACTRNNWQKKGIFYIGGGAETKSDFNFVKRIVFKFEMVKNVTLVE